MSSLINFFDKSYVINLPERQDRRKTIEWELKSSGVSLPSNKITLFPAFKPTDKGKFPSIGARGCFLSHLAVLIAARDEHLNNVLIIEDDLSFTNRFLKHQHIVANELQSLEWDFLYLGHIEVAKPTKTISFQKFTGSLQTASFLAINGRIIPHWVTFLEDVLNREAGHPRGGPMHVDGAYSTFRQQNSEVITLIAIPSLGFQRASPSDIAGQHWFDRLPVFKQLSSNTRRLKIWYQRQFKH